MGKITLQQAGRQEQSEVLEPLLQQVICVCTLSSSVCVCGRRLHMPEKYKRQICHSALQPLNVSAHQDDVIM